ncbi:unnamed protein product, partial [Amoebophrya sp. A25]|eukprot:GSA25T00027362001.1
MNSTSPPSRSPLRTRLAKKKQASHVYRAGFENPFASPAAISHLLDRIAETDPDLIR